VFLICFECFTLEKYDESSVTYTEIWRSPYGDAVSPYGNAASPVGDAGSP